MDAFEASKLKTRTEPVKVGDKFQGYWHAVSWRKTRWVVVEVRKRNEVAIKELDENDGEAVIITRREKNIWRIKGETKQMGGVNGCGDSFWPCDNPVREIDPNYNYC